MRITKYKYFIGVGIFLLLALWSLNEARQANKTEMVTMLVAVIGYFAFMVVDRIELAAAIERLDGVISGLSQPINNLQAQQLVEKVSSRGGMVRRLSSTDAFEYALLKVCSASRMYNTSFSSYAAFAGGPYYDHWLNAVVDGVTEHDCIIQEVMSSHERLDALRKLFKAKGKPLRGSYLAHDLSKQVEAVKNAPYVEFAVFEDRSGASEVIFGWTTSNSAFLGSDCFVIEDTHVVAYFKAQFRRYESLAEVGFLDK